MPTAHPRAIRSVVPVLSPPSSSLPGTRSWTPTGALTIDESGQISIQLAPIIAAVKQRLVARGLTLAERIPAVDKSIVIAQTDAAPKIPRGVCRGDLRWHVATHPGCWDSSQPA